MAARPAQGGSNNTWGTELNAHLDVSLDTDGTLRLPVTAGTGDAVTYANATTGQRLVVKKGTAGSPDSNANPLLKAERTLQVSSGSFAGDGFEPCAAILGTITATATNDGQAVGVAGHARSASTTVASSGGDDACGLYGIGRIAGSGTGAGIGVLANGRRETNTGKALGIEISVDNETATADNYSSTGFTPCTGVWLHATGTSRSGVGLAVGNPFGVQLDVGVGFTSQGTGGPILSSSIRDDSSSAVALDIRGTHATAALQIASGSGHVGIGAAADSAILVKMQTENAGNPSLAVYAHASQSVNTFQVVSSGGTEWFGIGSSGNLRLIDKNIVFGTTTGTQIGTTNAQKLAFWAATPAAQQVFATGTGKTVDNVITLLQSIGLCRQS